MHFGEFVTHIRNRRLREVAEHWNRARGNKLMPAWSDIDPLSIAPHLPIVWAWKYDHATDRFTGRLAGEEINDVLGKSLRGADMAGYFGGPHYEQIFARYKRLVTEPCLAHGHGRVFRHVNRVGLGERIHMPLAEDGEHGDGIFGATIYDPVLADGLRASPLDEDVTFYGLR